MSDLIKLLEEWKYVADTQCTIHEGNRFTNRPAEHMLRTYNFILAALLKAREQRNQYLRDKLAPHTRDDDWFDTAVEANDAELLKTLGDR